MMDVIAIVYLATVLFCEGISIAGSFSPLRDRPASYVTGSVVIEITGIILAIHQLAS